jgi:signal transduction histidine kinase
MMNFPFPASLIPENEDERLQKLYAYGILDMPAERAFDKITLLAARLFNTPAAQVTFVDRDLVFVKSNTGSIAQTPIKRSESFCALAVLNEGPTFIEDALQSPQFAAFPLVAIENGVRFYAAAPLRTSEGLQLGTLCVLDTQPRQANPQQFQLLSILASIIIDELEWKMEARKVVHAGNEAVLQMVHDLKNPTMTISLSAELIKHKANDLAAISAIAGRIKNASDKITLRLNELLTLSKTVDRTQP